MRSFTTRFFAGDDPIALLDEYRDEVGAPTAMTPETKDALPSCATATGC